MFKPAERAGAPLSQPPAAAPEKPAAKPAARIRPSGGRIQATELAGTKGTENITVVIGGADRMTGFAFDLTDQGAIRTVSTVSARQKKPTAQPGRKLVEAKPGYTVYGVDVDATDKVNAMRLVFVRLTDDDRIVAAETYESDWVGKPAGGKTVRLGCNGKKVVGFDRSRGDDQLTGIRLDLVDEPAGAAAAGTGGDGLD